MIEPNKSNPSGARNPSDQRASTRISVELEMTLGSEHNFYAGLCENISAGGLFIATHTVKSVGAHVQFKIDLPDGAVVEGLGEVRWVRVYNESSDTSPGLGIRFIELRADSAAHIARFVKQREPLFFDDE